MKDITLRERLKDKIKTIHTEYLNYEGLHTREYMWDFLIDDKVLALLESEIANARKEMRPQTRDLQLSGLRIEYDDANRIPPNIKCVTLTVDDKEVPFYPLGTHLNSTKLSNP